MAYKEKTSTTIFENCRCPHCSNPNAGNDFTSAIGSYMCSTNLERMARQTAATRNRVLHYPNTMFVMRHSERMDDMFHDWTKYFNDDTKPYTPFDLNMPPTLPVNRPVDHYRLDPMLTRTGGVIAQLCGRAFLYRGYTPDVIYSSPALRSLQTARFIRTASRSEALIRVEPGLFENLSLYDTKPLLVTEEQQSLFGVDPYYMPQYEFDEIYKKRESNEDYNERMKIVLRRIVTTAESTSGKNKNELIVLVVGHASTVDMGVGLLRDKPRPSTHSNLFKISRKIPYCSTICLQPKPTAKVTSNVPWEPVFGTIPPITYTGFTNKPDYAFLLRK
ncbi:unnamed protein product, partial [Mesorhabditis belari]|uniref:Uncharacterized protein n=1 Tax=Mesorhabditis belari TaxID=2138241 RepID=A0AAF3EVJ1_9BILA